ncbi:MAG: hypothetical protein HQK83_12835, partial [Fibrobacteria bacterium]|nr:hypothetical protein [Fibrobacteria bacterium]
KQVSNIPKPTPAVSPKTFSETKRDKDVFQPTPVAPEPVKKKLKQADEISERQPPVVPPPKFSKKEKKDIF